jgi:hypothetical protein
MFAPDSAPDVCFGEIRALVANAGLDASKICPRAAWNLLADPFLLLNLPSDADAHRILRDSVTAKNYYLLLAAAPTIDASVSQLAALPDCITSQLFDVRHDSVDSTARYGTV